MGLACYLVHYHIFQIFDWLYTQMYLHSICLAAHERRLQPVVLNKAKQPGRSHNKNGFNACIVECRLIFVRSSGGGSKPDLGVVLRIGGRADDDDDDDDEENGMILVTLAYVIVFVAALAPRAAPPRFARPDFVGNRCHTVSMSTVCSRHVCGALQSAAFGCHDNSKRKHTGLPARVERAV